MAKTIMISNEVYDALKASKKNLSFSELIKDLIETKKKKTGIGLIKHVGSLKSDKEYDQIVNELKPLYKEWTRKYA